MPTTVTTPHRPFDRLWQPGHPFRARRSRSRRWTMALLLIFMSSVISSYWYLTDPQRIKSMSQTYLSELVGGPVEIGSASLTILEGLKLSHVIIRVDDKKSPDSILLITDQIEIQYNPSSLLRGKLQATRIIATHNRVKLVEDNSTSRWNYQRLKPITRKRADTQPSDEAIPQLPQVLLRDAQVEYCELREGQLASRGTMAIEGNAFPSSDGSRLVFEVQSRGAIEGVGPVAAGTIVLKTGAVQATLSRFKFGRDIETMLPREVREFWVAHKLEGELDVPELNYAPGPTGKQPVFRLRTQLKHVKLIVRARELATPVSGPNEPTTQPSEKGLFSSITAAFEKGHHALKDLHVFPEQPPMQVQDVSGTFLFDESGIGFEHVVGTLAGATVEINGTIGGYSPDASVKMRLTSPKPIFIPANPDYLASLPPPAQMAFYMVHPQGTGNVWVDIERNRPGEAPRVTGELAVIDGAFNTVFFPYPARGASGKIAFFPALDEKGKPFERVELRDIHARGIIGGPNEHSDLLASGWLGGDNPDVGCRLHFSSPLVVAEPALFAALPPPARRAMQIFKGIDGGPNLQGTGAFDCDILVPAGKGKVHPVVKVDLNLIDGAGRFTALPYPMEKLHGIVNIGDGYVDLHEVDLKHGNAAVSVNGRVSWDPFLPDNVPAIVAPDVHLIARNVPIDEELLTVLPPDASRWLRAMGTSGTVDVDGPVVLQPTPANPGAIGFHLGVSLRDAKVRPLNSDFTISDAAGKLIVHNDHVDVSGLHGRRGEAELNGSGKVDWSEGQPKIMLNGSARNLALDEPLLKLMPEAGRQAWAAVDPRGTIDAEVSFAGVVPKISAFPKATAGATPATVPVEVHDFKLILHPRELSVTAQAIPYQLDHCTGSVTVDSNAVTISDFGGSHGKARVLVSGKALTKTPNNWDLLLKSRDIAADADLDKALPKMLRQMVSDLKLKGDLSVDLKSMRYRGDGRPDNEPDIDFNGSVHAAHTALNVGVPLTDITGDLGFKASVRKGKMAEFHGDLALDSVSFADRPITGFKAALDLPFNLDTVQINGIQGRVAGGDLAGDVTIRLPDQGTSNYNMNFVIKNADLREIAKQVAPKGQAVQGQLSASLALQGDWSDPKSRRGRGDVQVAGKQMYQIPLLLGLMEVTNLSLPTTSPFNEGTARYLVEGPRVTFEQIQMRSPQMVMSGNGWLDFDTRKVRMNFTTENPNMPRVPILNDLIAGAKQELLQIQVRGTVQNPTVSAASFHTFTTTVDEVFSGNEK